MWNCQKLSLFIPKLLITFALLWCCILVIRFCTLLHKIPLIKVKVTTSVQHSSIIPRQIPRFHWCPNKDPFPINIDCQRIFNKDEEEIEKAVLWKSPCFYSDLYMMKLTSNCSQLKSQFPFWSEFNSIPNNRDDNYSLAFVLIGAKSAEQIVRLMQTVYNKNNFYCITYDDKTTREFKTVVHNLDLCYDNIVTPDNFVNIYWGGYSILQSAMYCLKTLLTTNLQWRYVQILSWNDFPLRTNEELIKIMKIFNGAQDSLLAPNDPGRSRKYYKVTKHSTNHDYHLDPLMLNILKHNPPGNLTEYKGSLATTMSREFVEFQFSNKIAKEFYQWVNTTFCPEEIYWSTLIHNLHINAPGSFPGACVNSFQAEKRPVPYLSRFQIWIWEDKCHGRITSASCVFGVADLPQILNRPEFVAHKVYLDFEPATYYCLSQLHFNTTFFSDNYSDIDISFYEHFPNVRYRRKKDKSKQFVC